VRLDSTGEFVNVTVAVPLRRCAGVFTFCVPALVGCGPVEYLNQVSGRAATALAAARQHDAERMAPYEYATAVEYLHKAREEAGHSSFQVAIQYGRRAEELATRAESMAKERVRRPSPASPAPASAPRR
jgi:hypothetical protein